MMATWHGLTVGIWVGCVGTEVIFERMLSAGSANAWRSRLHARVDLVVELPAMLATCVTGALAWPAARPGPGLWVMAVAGGVALAANTVCIAHVLRRHRAAERGDESAWTRADRAQHRWGAMVVLALGVALAAGAGRAFRF